jgi:hypothetical protein
MYKGDYITLQGLSPVSSDSLWLQVCFVSADADSQAQPELPTEIKSPASSVLALV